MNFILKVLIVLSVLLPAFVSAEDNDQEIVKLTQLVYDKVPANRLAALQRLAELAPNSAEGRKAIVEALNHEDSDIRSVSAAVLGKLKVKDAVPALANALKDKSVEVRSSAAASLQEFGPDAASVIPALAEAVKDPEYRVNVYAAQALRFIGKPAIPALLPLLNSDQTRLLVIDQLGQMRDEGVDAVPVLIQLLSSSDAAVRSTTSLALARIGPPAKAAVPALAKLLKDPDKNARLYAAAALESIGPLAADAIPALIEALPDDDRQLSPNAATVLSKIGAAAVPALLKAYEDPRSKDRALYAISEMNTTAAGALPDLLVALESADPKLKKSLLYCFKNIGPAAKSAGPGVSKLLVDGDESLQELAAETLEKIECNDSEVVKQLIDAISKASPKTRALAIKTVRKLDVHDANLVPLLLHAAEDSDLGVRCASLSYLGSMKAAEALPLLKKALAGDRKERYSAVVALSGFGPEASTLASDVLRSANTADPYLKLLLPDLIKETLVKMGKDAIPAVKENVENPNPVVSKIARDVLAEIESGKK